MEGTALAGGRRRHDGLRCCPALGFALGPIFEDTNPTRWQDVGPEGDFNDETYVPRVISIDPEIGDAGKTTIYVRTFNRRPGQGHRGPGSAALRGDLHPLRPPRLSGALHPGLARSSSAPATAASTASRARSRAGPPVRPLDRFYTRVDERPRGGRRPLLAELPARALRPARPVEPPRRALAVPLPVEADHMKLPAAQVAAPQPPPRQGTDNGERTARTAATARRQPSRRPRTMRSRAPPASSAGSTSAPAPARSCAASSTARSRRAPTGTTRSARPRCSPSSRRRSPASSWPCTTSRTRRAPTSRRRTSPTTSSSASSCAACTSGARR